jgi:hypothetical protein
MNTHAMRVRVADDGRERGFVDIIIACDLRRVTVEESKVGGDGIEPRESTYLQPGQRIMVYVDDGAAQLVRMVPPPPINGEVLTANSDRVTIRPVTRPSEPTADPTFAVNAATKVFVQYYGGRRDLSTLSDLKSGDVVSVYAAGKSAEAIKIWARSLQGKVVKLDSRSITSKPDTISAAPPGPDETLLIDPDRTRVLLGQIITTTTRPSGKTGYVAKFVPGGHLSDLCEGQSVLVSIKDGRAVEVRVAPDPSQLK